MFTDVLENPLAKSHLNSERKMTQDNTTKTATQKQANQSSTHQLPTIDEIREGLILLGLERVKQTPLTTQNDLDRTFERYSFIKKSPIKISSGTGV